MAWGISFGWLTAKTWLQVYPLHAAGPLTTNQRVRDQCRSISRSGNERLAIGEYQRCSCVVCSHVPRPPVADIVTNKQAVWGSSFGWKSVTTWRAVWPTPYARIHPSASPAACHSGQQNDSSSGYPYLVICESFSWRDQASSLMSTFRSFCLPSFQYLSAPCCYRRGRRISADKGKSFYHQSDPSLS